MKAELFLFRNVNYMHKTNSTRDWIRDHTLSDQVNKQFKI